MQPINRVGKASSTDGGRLKIFLSVEFDRTATCVREIGVLRKIAWDQQARASGQLAIRVDTIHSLVTIKNGGKIGNPRLRLLTFSPFDVHLV